jgi:sulfate-transporting ATPase
MTLQVTAMTSLVLAALAAALVGDFKSFPIATAAGYALGMGQTLVGRFWDQQGVGQSLPFLLIIVMLVFRGRSIPMRDHFLRKLPAIGNGRMSWDWTIFLSGAVVFLILTKSTKWVDAITITLCASVILLSIVVVTGYAGQLSLAQYSMAGFGAWVAGRLVAVYHIPFLLGLLAGVVAAVPLGVLFALPAVRTRGINLAIVTLGLGTAIELMLFNNGDFTGGVKGTPVGNPSLFGYEISSIKYPERYGIFVLFMALLAVVVVANVRRGRSGRRLIAVRTNERAAAALGINIVRVRAGLGHRSARRHPAFVPPHLDQLPVLHQLHLDHLRRAVTDRRRRAPPRSLRRRDDGHGRLQPRGPRIDVGQCRGVPPADHRHRHPPRRAVQPRRCRGRVGQDVPVHEAHEEVR